MIRIDISFVGNRETIFPNRIRIEIPFVLTHAQIPTNRVGPMVGRSHFVLKFHARRVGLFCDQLALAQPNQVRFTRITIADSRRFATIKIP